ncbi:hypothetical protein SeMB42_g05094 [Synchytrium endobioticum]|uniref:Uncharacterized protein n=1 Tax=Synchytrium endobioticum TaxID=286115 RepID=A0A507CTR8_9FUNG|nr:hypothetical protein SeMB42_g05094 [Synchytrium endobioticum]
MTRDLTFSLTCPPPRRRGQRGQPPSPSPLAPPLPPPPPFLVPDPTDLDLRFTDAEADAYANASDGPEDLTDLPDGLSEAADVCVNNVARMLGPRASTECLRLTASYYVTLFVSAPLP